MGKEGKEINDDKVVKNKDKKDKEKDKSKDKDKKDKDKNKSKKDKKSKSSIESDFSNHSSFESSSDKEE
jgi:hypothetical protein